MLASDGVELRGVDARLAQNNPTNPPILPQDPGETISSMKHPHRDTQLHLLPFGKDMAHTRPSMRPAAWDPTKRNAGARIFLQPQGMLAMEREGESMHM